MWIVWWDLFLNESFVKKRGVWIPWTVHEIYWKVLSIAYFASQRDSGPIYNARDPNAVGETHNQTHTTLVLRSFMHKFLNVAVGKKISWEMCPMFHLQLVETRKERWSPWQWPLPWSGDWKSKSDHIFF